ncbi:MAG TPA: HAD-IIIC family phosphatase [Steroidobacteraceae bacterium]
MEKLSALAQCRLGFVESIQVDHALTRAASGSAAASETTPGFARIRLAVLASSTVDHLLPAIRVAALRRRLLIETYTGSFGQYRQELLDPESALHGFSPQWILLAIGSRDIIGQVALAASREEADRVLGAAVEDLRALWRRARTGLDAVIIQQTFLDVSEPLFGSYDRLVPGSPARLTARLNELVADAAARDGVLLLDIERASARDGVAAWFDNARWLQAKIEIAPQAAPLYGELLARLIAASRGQSKKCLVLDLDDTLWGGVIGELGVSGIVLGEGSAVGEAHLALQRYAKSLTERGIILAICSKNDPANAEEAFNKHPEMLLKRSDIAAFVANWADKAENLRSIAAQLNIGLDSLVFVDDNPAERARVRQSLPMVAVPELADDPVHYVRCLADAGYFEAVAFTDEDRQRAQQYAANNQREALRSTIQSMDDFLRGLEMWVDFGAINELNLARVTQLINKTNQFNTTTQRYTTEEVLTLAAAPRNITLQFRLGDRFGDNGLVSVMILREHHGGPQTLEVLSWVMSCRVFGRQLEHEAMNIAVEAARARGTRRLRAELIATKKNGVISNLYAGLGFSRLAEATPAGTSRWGVDLADYVPKSTFIRRRVQT